MNKLQVKLGATLALALVLGCVSFYQASNSAMESLYQQLITNLPERILEAGVNRLVPSELADSLAEQINRDLRRVTPSHSLSLVDYCQARVLSLYEKAYLPAQERVTPKVIPLGERFPSETLTLGMRCEPDWPRLAAWNLFLAAGVVALVSFLPVPLSSRQRQWAKRFRALGKTPRAARLSCAEVERLDERAQDWLSLALRHFEGDIERAFAVARKPDRLMFDPRCCRIWCHGVPVELSATPFIYYLWYARRRVLDTAGGWLINPAANRPDKNGAQELIQLMEQHGGHSKAIKDLAEKGLKAKTLDQNRSKVKEELIRALGESLASDYLFEMSRDSKVARYRYRLALAPERVELPE